ncbi:PspC domain-containing protein [Daejeonella oryzae]|uniref:PspC domain-containing protein n=1 Tax=Daejeonella oryzae TaxID=1122943 RepID=UPI00040AD7F5|nr:PspC domain-containing protein [Daejeonella oryzae]
MEKKLQRNEQEKVLAGVCAGLADYFDVDVTWVRIAFVVATLAGASGFLAYIILWIAVPVKPFNYKSYNADYRVYEDKAPGYVPDLNEPGMASALKPRKSNSGRMIVGLLMIIFGAFFLLDQFNFIPYWFDFEKLWPLVFIVPGILLITKAGKKESHKDVVNENTAWEAKAETSTTTTSTTVVSTEQPTTVIKTADDQPSVNPNATNSTNTDQTL